MSRVTKIFTSIFRPLSVAFPGFAIYTETKARFREEIFRDLSIISLLIYMQSSQVPFVLIDKDKQPWKSTCST